jgi:chromosome partitioning protein
MKVVVVASRKGGSGKTTLVGQLSVQAEFTGSGPVAVMDVDPQGSLAEWWNARAASTPAFVRTTVPRLAEDVARLRGMGIELLIIDTPPAMSEVVESVVALADLVLIPTRPSPHDLRSIGATVDLVEHLGTPLVFVLNAAIPRARITGEAVSILSQHGLLAPVVVHHRVDFASSMIDGRSVMELSGARRSAEEIEKLWGYLDSRLRGRVLRAALPTMPSATAPQKAYAMAGGER